MNIEIANRLQKLRKEKGYSQEQLADALGISRQAVSKWERAESSPDTDNLICLAKLYGISLDELLSTDQSIEEIKQEQEEKGKEETENADAKKEGDHVQISLKGIDVLSKEGEHVHVGWDGIHVHDHKKDEHVDISPKGIRFRHKKKSKAFRYAENTINGVVAIGTVIAYILLGIFLGQWHTAWILFFLIPLVATLIEAIYKRKFTEFGFPILIVALYLYLGMVHHLWHPYWFLFLTIPLYYILVNPIDDWIHRKDPSICIEGDDCKIHISDIEDDDDVEDLTEKIKNKSFTINVDGDEIHIENRD